MYPQPQLIRLAAYKTALRRDIVLHRDQCVAAAARVEQPLVLLDRMLALIRRLSSFALIAAVPLAFFIKPPIPRSLKILRALVRWGPLVFSTVRGIRSSVTTHFGSSNHQH
jgi:hypothetical protein